MRGRDLGLLFVTGMIVGCGLPQSDGSVQVAPAAAVVVPYSTGGLRAGWDSIHKAIFNKIDANHDGVIDEYEAGNYISLSDYQKADLNLDGVLQYSEFIAFATRGGFLQANDTPDRWVSRLRDQLGRIFNDLDSKHQGLLERNDVSKAAMDQEGLAFSYDNLNIHLVLDNVTDAEYKAADHTGDGKLSPAEFEDLYVNLVIDALNPPPVPVPTPAPPTPVPGTTPSTHK